MAQSILIYDFGTNEEAAQQARHKIESWQQGLRLGKKILIKFERTDLADEAASSAADSSEKASAAKPAKKKAPSKADARAEAKSKDEQATVQDPAPPANVRLMIRLGFSDHEKLIQQRVLDRFTSEEPFKSAKGETIRQGSPTFGESAEIFDNLD